tara:strand:- start:397 stop:876 length:480 start_codon:yes stop_codon:yes gene_type:complete
MLLFDSFCTLPVYFVVFGIVGKGNGGWIWLCALNNLCRIKKFSKYFHNFVEMVESLTGNQVATGKIRLFEMFLLVSVVAHWLACIFCYIGRLENEMVDFETDETKCYFRRDCSWMLNHFPDGQESTTQMYLVSFYWALYTISTTGYGNISLMHQVSATY